MQAQVFRYTLFERLQGKVVESLREPLTTVGDNADEIHHQLRVTMQAISKRRFGDIEYRAVCLGNNIHGETTILCKEEGWSQHDGTGKCLDNDFLSLLVRHTAIDGSLNENHGIRQFITHISNVSSFFLVAQPVTCRAC